MHRLVIVSAACMMLAPGECAAAANSRVSVKALRCEYRVNPLGIDVARPRLSWVLHADERGQKQTAYRVIVARSPETLARDNGDLWDSGKVVSDQSVHVPYAGKPLASGTDCYWKVRVWDKDGKATRWSQPARFSIGLLKKSDWKGRWMEYAGERPRNKGDQWIWLNAGHPAREAPAGTCYFRRVFTLQPNRTIESARMRMTADNEFDLWVNGKHAGAGNNWQQTCCLNIKPLLRPGDNVLAVRATNTAAGPAGLIGTLEIKYNTGDTLIVATDGTWRAAKTVENHWQTGTKSTPAWSKAKALGPKGMAPWSKSAREASKDRHIWYRKTFMLEEVVEKAFVYVASLGYHELYVNGRKADDRVLAPAGSRIDKRVLYVTYDVTDRLRAGNNVLAIWHGPGWARFFRSFKTDPALLVQANIVTRGGDRRPIASDGTWKCRESSSRHIGKGYGGEEIDARKRIADWNAAGFDDSGWARASTTDRDLILSAQTVQPDRIIETIKPAKVTEIHGGTYKVDMGRNYTGWLEIRNLHGSPGQRITIHVADDPKSREDFGQISAYICGKAPGTFRNRFNYAGGRFVRIEGLSDKPSLSDIKGYAISSDFKRTGRFRCSSALLNRIYETDLWTFRANTVNGVTMDCPHRERLGYGEVTWATAWGCGLPNYRAGALYTHLVRNWCDVQHENGSIWFVAPQMRFTYGGTLWSSAPVTVGWETYRQYGDKRLLSGAYPTYKRWMDFLDSKVSEEAGGILTQYIMSHRGRFLGDWAAPGGRKEWGNSQEALLFNNCVYAMNLKMMMDIAAALNKNDDAALYAQRLKQLRTNIHETFFDAEREVYLDGRQIHLAFPLYVGVVPEDVKPAVLANLRKEITQNRPYLDMGSSGLPVLLHYLIEDVEWNDILYEHISKTTRPSFGYFLKKDETTWPEYWEVNVPSKIHTCYTGVASWFIKGIGGIRNDPDAFGCKRFVIKPHPVGDLTFADTAVESLYGPIVSHWRLEDGRFHLDATVPPNSTATVYVPGGDINDVKESGKPARHAEGTRFVRAENGYLVFRVQAGAYRFVSAL